MRSCKLYRLALRDGTYAPQQFRHFRRQVRRTQYPPYRVPGTPPLRPQLRRRRCLPAGWRRPQRDADRDVRCRRCIEVAEVAVRLRPVWLRPSRAIAAEIAVVAHEAVGTCAGMASGQVGGNVLADVAALLGIGHATGIVSMPGRDARQREDHQRATPAPKHVSRYRVCVGAT